MRLALIGTLILSVIWIVLSQISYKPTNYKETHPGLYANTALPRDKQQVYQPFPPDSGWHQVFVLDEPHDGDTCLVGFIVPLKARLAKINAPELAATGGQEAKTALASKLIVNKPYRVWLYGREKFGRTLMEFYDESGRSINQWLVDSGHATPYNLRDMKE